MKEAKINVQMLDKENNEQPREKRKSDNSTYQIAGTMNGFHRSYHPDQEHPRKRHHSGSLS